MSNWWEKYKKKNNVDAKVKQEKEDKAARQKQMQDYLDVAVPYYDRYKAAKAEVDQRNKTSQRSQVMMQGFHNDPVKQAQSELEFKSNQLQQNMPLYQQMAEVSPFSSRLGDRAQQAYDTAYNDYNNAYKKYQNEYTAYVNAQKKARKDYLEDLKKTDRAKYYEEAYSGGEETARADIASYQKEIEDALLNGDYQTANDRMHAMIQAPLTPQEREKATAYIDSLYKNGDMKKVGDDGERDQVSYYVEKILQKNETGELGWFLSDEEGDRARKEIEKRYGIPATLALTDPEQYISAIRYAAQYDQKPASDEQQYAYDYFQGGNETWQTLNAKAAFRTKTDADINRAMANPAASGPQMDSFSRSFQAIQALNQIQDMVDNVDQSVGPDNYTVKYLAEELKQYGVNLGKLTDENILSTVRNALYEQQQKYDLMRKTLKQEGYDTDSLEDRFRLDREQRYELARRGSVEEWAQKAGTGEKIAATLGSTAEAVYLSPFEYIFGTLPKVSSMGSTRNPNEYVPENGFSAQGDLIKGAVRESLTGFGKTLYDAAASGIESTLGGASYGPTAYLIAMGMRSADAKTNEILQRGGSRDQAMIGGVTSGLIEAASEIFTLEGLFKMKQFRGGFKNFVYGLTRSMGFEASEELTGGLADILADSLIMGNLSEQSQAVRQYMNEGMSYEEAWKESWKDSAADIGEAMLAAGLSAGGSSFIFGGAGLVANRKANKALAYQDQIMELRGQESARTGEAAALQQYALDNKLDWDRSESSVRPENNEDVATSGEETEQKEKPQQDKKAQKKQSQQYRTTGEDVTRVRAHLTEQMEGKSLQEQQELRDQLIEQYGQGISRAANRAISAAISNKASKLNGPEAIRAAREEALVGLEDADMIEAVKAGYDNAVQRRAMFNGQKEEADRYYQQLRNTGKGSMSMEAVVTDDDGNEKRVKIAHMTENGKGVVLDDGTVIDVGELQGDADTVDVIQRLANMGLGKDTDAVLQAYLNSGVAEADGYRWIMDYATAYHQGRRGSITLEQAVKRSSLDAKTVMDAYTKGQQFAHALTKDAEANKQKAKKKGITGKKSNVDDSELRAKGITLANMSESERKQYLLANKIFRLIGVDVKWIASDTVKNKRGRYAYTGENGSYLNGVVTLDIHAGQDFADQLNSGILATTGHELTHFLEVYAPTEYKALKEFLFKQIAEKGEFGEATLEQMIYDKQRRSGFTISELDAEHEVLADACQEMLLNSEAIREFAEENENVVRRMVKWLDQFFTMVKNAFKESTELSDEAQFVASLEKDVRKAFGKLWDDALREAVRTHDEVGNIAMANNQVRQATRPATQDDIDIARAFNNAQTEKGSPLSTIGNAEKLVPKSARGKPSPNIMRYNGIVGKEVSGQLYVHKNYAALVIPNDKLKQAKTIIKATHPEFEYRSVMYEKAKNTIRFDEAPNFDYAREPYPGWSYTVNLNDGSVKKSNKYNKQIWHHKWMWVQNDYKGFDHDGKDGVLESWEWSKKWLNHIRYTDDVKRSNRGIANGSAQGYDVWNAQLKYFSDLDGVNLPPDPNVEENKRYSSRPKQEFTSEDTSIPQVPSTFKEFKFDDGDRILDYGGGQFNIAIKAIEEGYEKKIKLDVVDAFNRTDRHNQRILQEYEKNPADVVTVNNVLNVIKEPENRLEVAQNAKKYVKKGGIVYFLLHPGSGEDAGTGKGAVTKTNKGDPSRSNYQTKMKPSAYMPMLKTVFNHVYPTGEFLLASDEPITKDRFKKFKKGDPVKDRIVAYEDAHKKGAPSYRYGESTIDELDQYYLDAATKTNEDGEYDARTVSNIVKHIANREGLDEKTAKALLKVKRDKNGNVIPISQRVPMNEENFIRFSFRDSYGEVTRGINIDDSDVKYSELIKARLKHGETREKENGFLKNLAKTGERIALIRSGVGNYKAYATTRIGPQEFISREDWEDRFSDHRVPPNTKYDLKDGMPGKYYYPFVDLEILPEEVAPTSNSQAYGRFDGARHSDRDTEYLELAKDPVKNQARLQEMVDEAAREAGYKVLGYHGSPINNIHVFDGWRGVSYFTNDERYGKAYAESSDNGEILRRAKKAKRRLDNRFTDYTDGMPKSFNIYDTVSIPQDYDGEAHKYFSDGNNDAIYYAIDKDEWGTITWKQVEGWHTELVNGTDELRVVKGVGERETEFRAKMQEIIDRAKGVDAPVVYRVYLKMDNPYISRSPLDGNEFSSRFNDGDVEYTNRSVRRLNELKSANYDGIIVPSDAAMMNALAGTDQNADAVMDYVVFSPEQVKSADPVTYDDSGNVIPLSERFNSKNQDIRYSIRTMAETAGIEMRPNKDGKLLFYIDGAPVTHVTPEHIRDHSAFGALIKTARDGIKSSGIKGHITEAEANKQFSAVAELMNLIMTTQNPEMIWEVTGSQLFAAIKSNSDGQYSTTVDFSTVCRKTAEIVKAMSERMMKLGRGLSKDEVTQLQKELIDAGAQVPCPVCYVFSRWAGAGTLLDLMRRFQEKYADSKWDDPETLGARIKELENRDKKNERKIIRARLQEDDVYKNLVARKENLQAQNRENRKALKKAIKEDNAEAKDRLERSIEFNDLAIKKAQKEIDQMEKDENVASQELAWLKRVRSKNGYEAVPLNVLFNMYDTKAVNLFMTKYKDSWGYRTSRGPSAGKAILPYADMRLGDLIQPLKKKSSDGNKAFAKPTSIDGKFNQKQEEAIVDAIARTRAQNLIGGQRFQSTSDFRYDYALDYIQVFFEAQALGSNMQTYTKIIEFGEMVARFGGDVNLSAMPLNKGFVVDETDKDGNMVKGHLIYSNVTGIDINAAIRLKDQYDSAQIILVGINDDHIRLALEDSEETGGIHIGFVIPYHASGASIDEFIRVLVSNLNEDFKRKNYQDYSDVQTDKEKAKATVNQLRMRELRTMLLTGKQSVITETVDDDGKTKRTKGSRDWTPSSDDIAFMRNYAKEQIDITGRSFKDLRDVEKRALAGDPEAIHEYERWSSGVLWDLYQKMWTKKGSEYGVRLAAKQAEAVMPHEYWNKDTRRYDLDKNGKILPGTGNAYVNGFIFRSYCYNLGLHPRFTGINSKGKQVDHGDFSDLTGYWKTLIDRAMYANDGSYRDQKKINLSEMDPGIVTPEYGEAHWGEFKVKEPDMERAAQVGRGEHKSQKRQSARDTEYLELAKDPVKNQARLRELVEQAARAAGYPVLVYHGTKRFGFTKIKASEGDDHISFFATPDLRTARTYSATDEIRDVYKGGLTWEEVEAYREKSRKEMVSEIASYGTYASGLIGIQGWVDIDDLTKAMNQYAEMLSDGYLEEDEFEEIMAENFDTYAMDLHSVMGIEDDYVDWVENDPEGKRLQELADDAMRAIREYANSLSTGTTQGNYQLYINTDNLMVVPGNDRFWSDLRYERDDLKSARERHEALDREIFEILNGTMDGSIEFTPELNARVQAMIAERNDAAKAYNDLLDEYSDKYNYKPGMRFNTRALAKLAKQLGYAGVRITSIYDDGGHGSKRVTEPADVYILLQPETQAKSADLVTYDDKGNIIPLSERFNPENPDIRYSMRDYDNTIDDYDLIMESDGEGLVGDQLTQLKETKERISRVQSLRNKLAETRAELREAERKIAELEKPGSGKFAQQMRAAHAEAQRDIERAQAKDQLRRTVRAERDKLNETRRALRVTENKLAKQIQREEDIVNRKLTPLPLQRLLAKEREDAVRKAKEDKDAVFKRYRERKAVTEIRNRIRNLHAEMSRDLLKPREGHFVPRSLLAPVVELLETVNVTRDQTLERRLQELDAKIARAKTDEQRQALEDQRIGLLTRIGKLSEKINAVNAAYDAIKKDERYSMFYDETVKDMLVELSSTIGKRSIYELGADELNDVYTVMKAMRTTIRNAIKADLVEKGRQAWEVGSEMTQELRQGSGAHGIGLLEAYHMAMLSGKRAFNRFGGYKKNSMWNKVWNMLDKAQMKMLNLELQATRIFDPVLKAKEDFEKAQALTSYKEKDLVDVGLKDADGKPVKITRGMMLSLYMHLQNEQNMRHIMYGGMTLPDYRRYYKGLSEAWGQHTISIPALGAKVANLDKLLEEYGEQYVDAKYKQYEEEIRALFESVRSNIEDELTDYDRKWIAASKAFFDDFSRKELNAVTNEMYGFSKASVDNYYPIVTDKNFLKKEFESISKNIGLENAGFMKERVQAANPILLEDITRAVNRQITNVSRYAGLTQALKTFGMVYNVQTKGFTDSFKKAISDNYGERGLKYIENLITDMIGGRSVPGSIFDRIKGNYAQAVLSANVSVTMKQAASYPTAAATVGWKPLMKALAKGGRNYRVFSRADRALIDTYTPLLWYRAKGSIDTEIGEMQHAQDWTKKAKWLMGWIQGADKMTVGRLWYAAEYYVQDHFKLEKGTAEQIRNGESPFYRKVAEVFADIVEDTQPNYTVLQRPDILRNPNKLVRAMTMFSTQRFQNANILIDAAGEYAAMLKADKRGSTAETKAARAEAKSKLTRAISSQVVSTAVLAVMTFVANALMHRMNPWRDDDDELTQASIAREFADTFLSTMSGAFLGGSELYEAISSILTGSRYYGNDVGGISTINDFATAVVNFGQKSVQLIKDDESKPEDWKKLVDSQLAKVGEYLAQITGVPIANVNKIISGGINHMKDAVNGEFLSFEAGVERTDKVQARRLIWALVEGETETVDRILEKFNDADKRSKAVTARLKELYLNDEISEEHVIKYLMRFAQKTEDKKKRNLTEDEAYWKIREWEGDAEHKGEEGYSWSQYETIRDLLAIGADISSEVKRLTDHGVERKNVNEAVKDAIKELYTTGKIDDAKAMELLVKNHLTKDSKTKQYRPDSVDEAWFTVDEWAQNIENDDVEGYSYSKYHDLYDAIDEGKDIQGILDELSGHGTTDDALKDAIYDHIKERFLKGELSEDEAISLQTKYRGTEANDAYWNVDKWRSREEAAEAGEEFIEANYRDLYAAIDSNDDATAAVKELLSHGYKEDQVYDAAKARLVDRYVKGSINENALKNQLSKYAKVVGDDATATVNKAKYKKETGLSLDNLKKDYLEGKVNDTTAKKALTQYLGKDADTANKTVRWYALQKKNPDIQIDDNVAYRYMDGTKNTRTVKAQSAEKAGLSIEAYIKARNVLKEVKGWDKDGNGRMDNYSREIAFIQALSKMDLTGKQKWALYYEEFAGAHWNKIRKPNW